MRKEFLLSGSGGQGVITAAIILAEAALHDGKVATQTQAYGPEARGGSARAEAIISDEPIYYNKVNHPNILLAMSQEALEKYFGTLSEGQVLVTDSLFVREVPAYNGKTYQLPITHTAKQELGKALFANIVALGALVGITKVVSKEAIVKAVLAKVPKGTEEKNQKALELGITLGEKAVAEQA